MTTITDLWKQNKKSFENKSLSQILSFCGDGKLKDHGSTSNEFRALLDIVSSEIIRSFAHTCLSEKFEDNGFALQDIVNQTGKRLGYDTESGLYRGKATEIGYDGLWTAKDNHSLIVEVKTSDAYRINLDVVASYREKLIKINRIDPLKSSILIVVGRQDTGDLEAQIRGSKHAWDIRLISTDSLLQLLQLKEKLNDSRTLDQIAELLKPKEYTRIDELISLIFKTSEDLQLDEIEENSQFNLKDSKQKTSPVSFHKECIEIIEKSLNIPLFQKNRISYSDKKGDMGLICAISKRHKQGKRNKFWFAFHPYQQNYLEDFASAYICYSCGSPETILMIPFSKFKEMIPSMQWTQKEDKKYWHVVIFEDKGIYTMELPLGRVKQIDISNYRI